MPDFAVAIPVKGHITADKFSKSILGMGRSMDKFGKKSQSAFDKAARGGSRFKDIVKGILTADAIKGAIRSIWDFGKGAVELASDLTEVQNVVDTTFGDMSKSIDQWSKTAITKFGISELQAKKFTGTLGALMKSSGITGKNLVNMSTDLTGLAGDFASFYNLPIEEAFDKIKSGISGETEPLKALGINMSVANMETFALTKGITKQWKAMTQAEQTQLRYAYLMEKSVDAQGDFNKTLSTSFANQKRVFSTKIQQAAARMMTKILPALTDAFKWLNKAIDKIDFDKIATAISGVVPVIKILLKIFIGLVKIVAKTVYIWGPLVAGLIAYMLAMKAFIVIAAVGRFMRLVKIFFLMARAKGILTAAQWALNAAMSANQIALVIAGITALIAAGYLLYRNWDLVKKKFMEWTAIFDNPIFRAIATIFLPFITIPILIARNWDAVTASVSKAINFVKSGISSVKSFFGFGGESPGAQITAPNQNQASNITNVNINQSIDVTGPPGTKASSKTKGAPAPNMRLAGQN